MVRKHYYNFRFLTNMLKIRSRDLTVHMLIKFSKQMANSLAKKANRFRLLEVIRGKFKSYQTSEMELFLQSRNWL